MHHIFHSLFCQERLPSGTTWVSEVVSAILFNADMEALSKERLDERVPWLELDMQFVWAKFFFVWKSVFEGTSLRLPKHSPRTFFTHLPIELLPRDVLAGKCKVKLYLRYPVHAIHTNVLLISIHKISKAISMFFVVFLEKDVSYLSTF